MDAEEALEAIRRGRSFNVIHMPIAFKFDFFPAHLQQSAAKTGVCDLLDKALKRQ